MTLSALRLQRCRGLYRGGCGFCGSLNRLAQFAGCTRILARRRGRQTFRNRICFKLPPTGRENFTNPLCQPSSNLRIFRWGRELRLGWCDGCDDCVDILETPLGTKNIVTTDTTDALPYRILRLHVESELYMNRQRKFSFSRCLRMEMLSKTCDDKFSIRAEICGLYMHCKPQIPVEASAEAASPSVEPTTSLQPKC